MISAKVNTDSISESGHRITTMVVTMPRFILAEFNTHRMFSRNSASSRAIPFRKMLNSVKENPFIPIAWQEDHSGMQGTKYLSKTDKFELVQFTKIMSATLNGMLDKESKEYLKAKEKLDEKIEIIKELLQNYVGIEKTLDEWWLFARDKAVETAAILYVFNATKQLCNRLLEPFMWHTVIVTATEWENFFALRCPQYDFKGNTYRSRKDCYRAENAQEDEIPSFDKLDKYWVEWLKINKGQAEIHMMALAEAMWDAYNESTPKLLKPGEWHIPFGDNIEIEKLEKAIDASGFYGAISDYENFKQNSIIKVATARCAQTSYTVIGEDEKEMNYEKLIALHDRLAKSGHWSPFEHCARVMSEEEYYENFNGKFNPVSYEHISGWSGNFRGFVQYRKLFHNENITIK